MSEGSVALGIKVKLICEREKFPVYHGQKLSPQCEKLSYNIHLYLSFSTPLTCLCRIYMSKASNRYRTFPDIWVHLLRTYVMVIISSVLLKHRCIFVFAIAVLSFFGCFVYFSGFSFVCLLRLSMRNKKYK